MAQIWRKAEGRRRASTRERAWVGWDGLDGSAHLTPRPSRPLRPAGCHAGLDPSPALLLPPSCGAAAAQSLERSGDT